MWDQSHEKGERTQDYKGKENVENFGLTFAQLPMEKRNESHMRFVLKSIFK